jgi:hypothetical protein
MKNLIQVFVISILLSACSGTKILSDIDKEVNFNNYKTYSWSAEEEEVNKNYPQFDNTLNRKRWKSAIDAAMQNEGYVLGEEHVDLQVDFHLQFEHNTVVNRGYHIGENNYYAEIAPVADYHYDEGTLIIHLIDVERKQLVWQGISTRTLDISLLENTDTNIHKAVAKMFEKFHSQITKSKTN